MFVLLQLLIDIFTSSAYRYKAKYVFDCSLLEMKYFVEKLVNDINKQDIVL